MEEYFFKSQESLATVIDPNEEDENVVAVVETAANVGVVVDDKDGGESKDNKKQLSRTSSV